MRDYTLWVIPKVSWGFFLACLGGKHSFGVILESLSFSFFELVWQNHGFWYFKHGLEFLLKLA
ncbi:hypothetical protein BBW65_01705 [Helicobacter enhydrae]|uniref:Uncharacterized protein n=1 Tax=Helicobacter enhydrae TaxID=222136 RepID=A0A1B1U4C6_9HELI|nr:hypothetical protein BBW65_01705 [Helicobacter enhydrae]